MKFIKSMLLVTLCLPITKGFAGEMGASCEGGTLTTPCATTNWEFGGRALYLQPATGGVSGDRTFTTSTDAIASGGTFTKWGWGFMLEGSYHFNTGNDVNLNWYHYAHSTSSLRQGAGSFSASDLDIIFLTGLISVDNYTTHVSPRWDAINLEFGQLVNYDQKRTIRVHAGLAYVRLDADMAATITGTNTPTGGSVQNINIYRSITESYNGIGPRLGADLAYAFTNTFSVYADGAVALFIGSSKYSDNNDIQNITIGGTNSFAMPGLEAKLGAIYLFPFAGGNMKVDAGWLWNTYIGAMTIPNPSLINGPDYHNFSMEGPYLGLRWLGNLG